MRSVVQPELRSEVLGTGWCLFARFHQLSCGIAKLLIRPIFKLRPQAAPLSLERSDPLAWWNGQTTKQLKAPPAKGPQKS